MSGGATKTSTVLFASIEVCVMLLLWSGGMLGAQRFGGIFAWQAGYLLGALAVRTVLALYLQRRLGTCFGTLTAGDLGFLDCSGKAWVWGRYAAWRLFYEGLRLLSCLPSLLAFCIAELVWNNALLVPNAALHLFLYGNLLLLGMAFLVLPLLMTCAIRLLPFCYLKQPHFPCRLQLRILWAIGVRHCLGVLLRDALAGMLCLLPPLGIRLLPRLHAVDQRLVLRSMQRFTDTGKFSVECQRFVTAS